MSARTTSGGISGGARRVPVAAAAQNDVDDFELLAQKPHTSEADLPQQIDLDSDKSSFTENLQTFKNQLLIQILDTNWRYTT